MATIEKIHSIRQALEQQNLFFCYSGYMTEEVLLSFGNTIRQKLELVKADRKVARAVFAIFVEETQNIVRYSKAVLPASASNDDSDVILRHGFFAVGTEGERYFICCGNLVLHADAARLKEHLEHIKGLDADGLKSLYKDILKNEVPEGSKGAGVGFVDIARRAKGEFEFDFIDVSEDHAYFYLKAYA